MAHVRTAAVRIRVGESPVVVTIDGRFDAEAEAALEDTMRALRGAPRDVVFDVSLVDRLDVEGLLVLADHACWLRRRSCNVLLHGATPEAEQLARLLGYERTFGLT